MLLIAKVIAGFCTVAVPMSVCGAQAFLTNNHQVAQVKKINQEIQKTSSALETAKTKYLAQIKRITDEKNALATTKESLTYKPVNISSQIQALTDATKTYKSHHTVLQEAITTSIASHNNSLTTKTTEIEKLWTDEKTRVENISQALGEKIETAKNANKKLVNDIDELKKTIDEAINKVFYTAPDS